jgi:hypothetical protein
MQIVKRAISFDILHRVLKSLASSGSLLDVLQYFKIKAVFTRNIQGVSSLHVQNNRKHRYPIYPYIYCY